MSSPIEILEKSPIFQFSLHSKELFHSNFLAWLGNDTELRLLFRQFMRDIKIAPGILNQMAGGFEVLREKNDLDILVKTPDYTKIIKQKNGKTKEKNVQGDWLVVLENKVKSIPTADQLKGYSNKINDNNQNSQINTERILLSILPHNGSIPPDWRNVSYFTLIESLKKSIHLVTDPYKKTLVEDYITMTEALVKILTRHEVTVGEPFLKEIDSRIVALRIDDLVNKWRFAKIADMVSRKHGIDCKAGFTNVQPLLEVEVKGSSGIGMGIQIQGTQYRHYIYGNLDQDSVVKSSHDYLCNERKEFRERMIKDFGDIFLSTKIKGEDKKQFCSYKGDDGKTFWYQYATISPTATVNDIIQCLYVDSKNIPLQ